MYVNTQCPKDGGMLHLVVVFLMPSIMETACVKRDACEYVDTRPQGVPSMTSSMRDIYPRSCDAVCSLTDGCVAVTLDPSGTMCYFFNESDDLRITQDPGATLVLFQAQGVPCIEVSWMTIHISEDRYFKNAFKFQSLRLSRAMILQNIDKYRQMISHEYMSYPSLQR